MEDYELGSVYFDQYKNPDHFHKKVGYQRGEAIPFGIRGIFDDGTETDVYPIKGNVDSTLNNKGIFRFPKWSDESVYSLGAKISAVNSGFRLKASVLNSPASVPTPAAA